MLIQWEKSDNPCLRIGRYKDQAYYVRLSMSVQFRGGLVNGVWEPRHCHVAKVSLLTSSGAIGLTAVEEEELGVMQTGERSELVDWMETAQSWAETVLVSPMQRLVDKLQQNV
jgi:hypothetical protein